jgi:hypothetical protein
MTTRTLRKLALLPALFATSAFAANVPANSPSAIEDIVPGSIATVVAKGSGCAGHQSRDNLPQACVDGQWSEVDARTEYSFGVKVLRREKGGAHSVAATMMLHGGGGVPISYFTGHIESYLSGTGHQLTDYLDGVTDFHADREPTVSPTPTFDSAFASLGNGAPAPETLMQALDLRDEHTEKTTDSLEIGDALTITPLGLDDSGAVHARIAFKETTLVAMRDFRVDGELKAQAPETKVEFGEQTVRIPRGKTVTVRFGSNDLEVNAFGILPLIGDANLTNEKGAHPGLD